MSLLSRFFRGAASTAPIQDEELFGEDFLRRLQTLALASRKAASRGNRGERRARKKGSGVEFADHRNYVPGDDFRFLDVSIYQRFGKLLLRVFEEEEDLSVYLLVDCSASMGMNGGEKLRQASRIGAALGYIALTSLDRVSAIAMTDRVVARMPPTRGRQRVFRLLHFFEQLQAGGKTDLEAALKTFAVAHKRRGLAIVLSDFFDPAGFEAGINVLRFNKFEVGVLQLTSPIDTLVEPVGDLRVVDVETGRGRDVTVTEGLRRAAIESVAENKRHIESYCASRGVPYFEVDVRESFDDVVLSVLRRGGLLR